MADLRRPATPVGTTPLAAAKSGGARLALRYAPIEIRRNRVLYAGWPFVILGTIPFAAAIAYGIEIPVQQATGGVLAAWVAAGLPLTAVLFGAVAGAGLRGPTEDAEFPLPISPRQRAFGAMASAAAALGSNAAFVALLIVAMGLDVGGALIAAGFGSIWRLDVGRVAGVAAVAGGAGAWLLTTSFTAAFAASHAVLGAVAALVGGGLLLLPVAVGYAIHQHQAPNLAVQFLAIAFASTALATAGSAAALAVSAPAVARAKRLSWRKASLLTLLPLAGSLGSWTALSRSAAEIRHRITPVYFEGRGFYTGIGGRLIRRTAAGDVVLMAGSEPSIAELANQKRHRFDRIINAAIDGDGRAWAVVISPPTEGGHWVRTIWTGPGNGPLTRYFILPPGYDFLFHDGRAFVYAHPGIQVPLDPAKPPVLKRQ